MRYCHPPTVTIAPNPEWPSTGHRGGRVEGVEVNTETAAALPVALPAGLPPPPLLLPTFLALQATPILQCCQQGMPISCI